jgi:hypothetical protein
MKISRNTTQLILAILGVVFCLAWFAALLFVPIPEANKDLINIITGALLSTCIAQIYNYYFGSSKSSADKTDLTNGGTVV